MVCISSIICVFCVNVSIRSPLVMRIIHYVNRFCVDSERLEHLFTDDLIMLLNQMKYLGSVIFCCHISRSDCALNNWTSIKICDKYTCTHFNLLFIICSPWYHTWCDTDTLFFSRCAWRLRFQRTPPQSPFHFSLLSSHHSHRPSPVLSSPQVTIGRPPRSFASGTWPVWMNPSQRASTECSSDP